MICKNQEKYTIRYTFYLDFFEGRGGIYEYWGGACPHVPPPHSLQDLKDLLASNVLVPVTTAHLQKSCVVHALMSQCCLGCTWGPTQY